MEVKPKNPKRVEQGKKLALRNRERLEREKLEREERKKIEDEEFEKAADEFEAWKKQKEQTDTLTVQDNPDKLPEKKKDNSKMTVFIPALALTVIGVGTFWYYRETKTERLEKPERPKILARLEKFQK